MGIYKSVDVAIVDEGKCDKYIDENTICNYAYFLVLIVNGSKSYYCIECEMEDLKDAIKENV